MLETTSEATKKLSSINFKENGFFSDEKTKKLVTLAKRQGSGV